MRLLGLQLLETNLTTFIVNWEFLGHVVVFYSPETPMKQNHSTETVSLQIHDYLVQVIGHQNITDLSAC